MATGTKTLMLQVGNHVSLSFWACQYCHGFLSFSAALVRPLCGFETVILDLLQVILNGMNELFSQLDGTGGPIGYAIFWVFCDNNSNI